MNKKVLKAADVNYVEIDAELAALEPPTVTLQEVLERLDERVREMQSQGVTAEQMLGVLKSHGINIGAQRFRKYLATGKLPEPSTRVVRAALSGEGGDDVGF